jgi:hypothetical protein
MARLSPAFYLEQRVLQTLEAQVNRQHSCGWLVVAAASITNESVSQTLEEVAALLDVQDANPFRVHAWRHGGHKLYRLRRSFYVLSLAMDGSVSRSACVLVIINRRTAAALDQ